METAAGGQQVRSTDMSVSLTKQFADTSYKAATVACVEL